MRHRRRHRTALPRPDHLCAAGALREDWQRFSRWADDTSPRSPSTRAASTKRAMTAWGELDDYVDEMVARRRHRLTDDLVSDLIRAEDDGDRLNADELACWQRVCCWQEPTPPAPRWPRPSTSSARTPISGPDWRSNPSWRRARWRRRCATRRLRAARCARGGRGHRFRRRPVPGRNHGAGQYLCRQS